MKPKSAAVYARFSSEHQNERSIDDQFTLCRVYAEREGFEVKHQFSDRAKSGASMFERDGLLDLMEVAKARKFDAIIVESLDRLSRDQADLAGIFKRLKFYGIALIAVHEGEATDIHVGLRGIVGAMFLKDLGDKIRRHHFGRAREGHVMGIVSFGYRAIPGKPGEREIEPEQAAVVRRIFREYAAGISPREIAIGLTRDGIPTPSGGEAWSHQSFIGGGGKSGMLANRLYCGELSYNRHRTIRNPDGGFATRPNPESEHISTSVPHLRIIDQDLWDQVQAIRHDRASKRAGPGGIIVQHRGVKRSKHLLAGLLRCGQCNGHMIFTSTSRGRQFVACAAAQNNSTCSHRKSYDVGLLTKLVIDNFRANLISPERHAEAMKAAHAEYAALAKRNGSDRIAAERQLSRLTVQIKRLVDAIANTDRPLDEIMPVLNAKEAERVGLIERIRLLKADNVITLHPQVVDNYKAAIEKLHGRLGRDPVDPEVAAAFRNVMDSIVVQPTGYREPYVVDAYGRLSAIMGVELFPTMRSAQEILTDEGVSVAATPANHIGQVRRGNTRR